MKRFLYDMKRYWSYTIYAAKAELKADIIGSYLGWLWLILEPTLFMLIYAFVVQIVFKSGEPNLPVFVFTGYSIWSFFNKTVISSVKLMRSSRSIITKIYVPKYVLLHVRMFVNLFKLLVSFMIVAVLLAVYQVPLTANILYALPILLLLWIGTFAFSSILLHFGTFIEDLSNVMTVVLRLWFYLSGIFYSLPNRVEGPLGQALLHYNPVGFVINEMRNVLLYGVPLDLKWYMAWLGVCIVLSALGIRIIYKYESQYAKVI
ncbi:MAG: ABC transporter permease [Christensenellales bacterium]